jgi:hypothetical protein
VEYRLLTGQDAAAFQALRLRSLRDHTEAFGASCEEEARSRRRGLPGSSTPRRTPITPGRSTAAGSSGS